MEALVIKVYNIIDKYRFREAFERIIISIKSDNSVLINNLS